MAKVTPFFKSGDSSLCTNYHPISILPTLGKLLDSLVHDQLYTYLTSYNILSDRQSGFRKGYSTGTCLVEFLHTIYSEIDEGGACGVLFLDLSKAFDTVDHNVIKLKLKSLGIKESSVSWFDSYLCDRSQYTVVEGSSSHVEQVGAGVPQGSILGPLLFTCYINDLTKYTGSLEPFLYADDTALLAKGKDLAQIQQCLQTLTMF